MFHDNRLFFSFFFFLRRTFRTGLRTSECNLVPTGVCGVLGDATPVRNLLSRGLGYDEGGVRNRETGGVGWLRWNTGRVSSKETTWRVEGGRKEGGRKCRRGRGRTRR